MPIDSRSLAELVTNETDLEFVGAEGRDTNGNKWLELRPAGHLTGKTFSLRTVIGWRRVDIYIRPDNFAGELVQIMGQADESGRQAFRSVLEICREAGADVALMINGVPADPRADEMWISPWKRFELTLRCGMLSINQGDTSADRQQIELWSSRAAAAVVALLPLEVDENAPVSCSPDIAGLPEGAKLRVEVNRYERDRRNRSAALAIHGYACLACSLNMSERYGPEAAGLIEVHHITPVSNIGPDYIVDPKTDLVPLCPNCHSVAHRRSPPFSIDQLREMQRIPEASSSQS